MTRCNVLLDSPQFYMPKTLCRAFTLEGETEAGWETLLSTTENRVRSYAVPVGKKLLSLRLVPLSNWGEGEKTTVFSFDFQ